MKDDLVFRLGGMQDPPLIELIITHNWTKWSAALHNTKSRTPMEDRGFLCDN